LYRFTVEELETGKGLFERAIELDGNFAQAYSRLAYVHVQLGWYGPHEERTERLADATALANTAIELDDREPTARFALGRALILAGDSERGIEELRASVALEPSYAQGRFALGQGLCYVERPQEGLAEINEALRLSPRDPHLWTFLNVRAIAHYQLGAFAQAEADERLAMRQPNATHWPAFILLAVLGRQGKTEAAKEAIAEINRIRPGFTCADARQEWYFGDRPYMTPRFVDQFVQDVRRAGLPE
jgi:tetratricopeptide (TPR) repeat protein